MDSLFISIMTGSDYLLYDTKVGESAGRDLFLGAMRPKPEDAEESDAEHFTRLWHNIKTLRDAGADPLEVVVNFGHDNDIEVFATVRMNMVKDSWMPDFLTRRKRKHPEYCLDVKGEYDKNEIRYLYWSCFDYAQQTMRDYRAAMIDDICTRYDVDGIELDFMRWPMLFKPSLDANRPNPVTLRS